MVSIAYHTTPVNVEPMLFGVLADGNFQSTHQKPHHPTFSLADIVLSLEDLDYLKSLSVVRVLGSLFESMHRR
jgi:hypothetical protein